MESVGGEHGGVAMGGRKPAELGLDLVGPDPRRLQDRGSLGQLGNRGGRRGARGAALPLEADPLDQTVVDQEGDANQVAAGRAARGAAEGAVGRGPAARILRQELLQELTIHAVKLKRLQPAVFRPGLVTRVA